MNLGQLLLLFPLHCRKFASYSSNQPQVRYLIKQCNRIQDLKPLKSLITVSGFTHYKLVISEFIELCFHLDAPELGLSAFYASDNRSLLLQNVIIKHLCNLGLYHDALSVYKTCKIAGTSDGDYTFPYVIKACSGLFDVGLGREIHGVVIRTGYGGKMFVQTTFVDFYSKVGRMDIARKVFGKMSQWDVVSWNALISGYSFNGLDYEAVEVLQQLWVTGVKPNVSTLASIIPVCTRLGFRYLGKSLHGYAVKTGFHQHEFFTPALISMYAVNGDIHVARCLFDLSPIKNVIIWNSMIYAHAKNQMPDAALDMFQEMISTDLHPDTATFVSVIPCCEMVNIVCHGAILHGYVIKYGVDNEIPVVTALISMYGKLGDVHSAANVFIWIPHKNLLIWNSIVSVYGHNGLSRTSLHAVHEMQVAGIEADSISIINILFACLDLEALLLGKSAHAITIRKGYDLDLNVSNSLLAFYSSCRQFHFSLKLLNSMTSKNVISWNTMISGCIYNGETKKAAAFFKGMQLERIQPDVVSLISILPSLNEFGDLAQGMALHGFALKSCLIIDVKLANALISMYCSCGNLDAAAILFHAMTDRCLVSWNSLITGYRYHGLYKELILLFKEMMKEGKKPNYITLLNVLPGCSTLLQGKLIHSYGIRIGAMMQTPFVTSLIRMYLRFYNMASCFSLFEAGDKFDVSLWNAMMSVLFEVREGEKAFSLFCEMLQTEVKVDYVTMLSLVSTCIQINSLSVTNSVLAFVIKKGFSQETTVCNALIDLYAKCGDFPTARKVFDSLLDKDSVSWSVMINGYGLHGDGEGAIYLLSEMEDSEIMPDSITYLSILSACSHAGLADQSNIVFNSMLNHGIQPTIEHCACVLDLLGRKGLLIEAYDILKRMPGEATVSILESLLGACMVHRNLEVGVKVGELLISMDPENAGAYVTLHNIYAGAERWQDAYRIRSVLEKRDLSKVAGFSRFDGQN